MNDEQRYVCENFRTALNLVSTGDDGYPDDPRQATEWRLLNGLAYGLARDMFADPADAEEAKWRRAGEAMLALIAHGKAAQRDPVVAEELFAARADLPPMA
jgi:hypothetical protein